MGEKTDMQGIKEATRESSMNIKLSQVGMIPGLSVSFKMWSFVWVDCKFGFDYAAKKIAVLQQ